MSITFIVEMSFDVANRGAIVTTTTDLSWMTPGAPHIVRWQTSTGTWCESEGYVEIVTRLDERGRAVLVIGAAKEALPNGSIVEVLPRG